VLGHRLAAEWLERAGENDAALLAGHFERAGEALRAASLYRRAGEQALEGGDLAAARQHAQRGLTLGAAGDDRGGLELVDIEALKWLGETTLASQHADALRQTLPVGSLLWCRAVAEAAFERPDDGELADELLGVAATRENRAILTVCLARTAIRRLIWTAQPAAALLARLEAVAAGEPMVEGWLHEARGFVAIRAEALDQGAHCMRASNAAFERVGDSRNAMSALANLGFVMADLGQFPEVERDMIALVARAEAAGVSRIVRLASTVRAIALLHMGRPAEAAALGTSMGLDAASRALRIDALAVSVLIRLALGDAAGALVVARAGPGVHRGTMTLVARILLATGSPAQALAVLDAGDTEYQGVMGANMGIGPLATLLVRAETMHALGDRAAAGGLIAAAREHSLRSAGCIADGALRASLLATPTHARVHQLAREWGVER